MMFEFGAKGYGLFWIIIETLASSKNLRLQMKESHIKALSMKAMADIDDVKDFINKCVDEFDLLQISEGQLMSEELETRLSMGRKRASKASKAAKARWKKQKEEQEEVVPEQEEAKPVKRPAKRVKTPLEDRKKAFGESLGEYVEQYGKKMIRDFYDYWTEHGETDTKMRFEKEKTFSKSHRLARWNSNNFGKNDKQNTAPSDMFNFGN